MDTTYFPSRNGALPEELCRRLELQFSARFAELIANQFLRSSGYGYWVATDDFSIISIASLDPMRVGEPPTMRIWTPDDTQESIFAKAMLSAAILKQLDDWAANVCHVISGE
jgi:hypothetical protein